MRPATERVLVGSALAISLVIFGLQAFVLRPHLWPAGAGLALSSEVTGQFASPRSVAVIRPPHVPELVGDIGKVERVWPDGAAERAGIREGDHVKAIKRLGERLGVVVGSYPNPDPEYVLPEWRMIQELGPRQSLQVDAYRNDGATRVYTIEQPAIWDMPDAPWSAWLRLHLAPLAQMAAFLAGAAVLLALGAHGTTATLATLAMIATATANSGPLLGAERVVPLIGPLLLIFNWLITALSFPIIGLAVLNFPTRAPILDRHRWIVPVVIAASMPMFIIGSVTAAFLLGADGVLPALSWLAANAWTFEASFALALAVNVLIVIEGIGRYRTTIDPDERRRIQIVVYTGVPAVFAYALKTELPIVLGLLGMPIEVPWVIEALLTAIVLLPAFGLPYAVAVEHVFSPRTILRRSLQYALARRTLAALVAMPIIALVIPLVRERDMTLQMIVSGRPLFYLFFVAMLAAVLKYRDRAQRWLDQRFFRAEYDAREILVSLAGRVPYEADPRALVSMVVSQIDSALHPECLAVLATNSPTESNPAGSFESVASLRVEAPPLKADSGVITLVKWSDQPLEVFLKDDQSAVARVPPADRAWLESTKAALLVPIFAGGSDPRPLVGVIALGHKRSEEPYTQEDRELLRGIAVQMGVALDLSRLRKQAGATPASAKASAGRLSTPSLAPELTPTVVSGSSGGSGISIGALVDQKYRVDEVIGQGGMGAVYRAWDLRLERPVAIKVVRADLVADPDSRLRFRRESQIVARLQHPSIVTVYDYGHFADGSAFLVMEYVLGEDLRRLLRRERQLAVPRMAALLSGIAGGVDVAHKSGIFHRDLKPENILLPESGGGPKVVDFGVAKLANAGIGKDSTISVKGTIVGTPTYMSPEQLRGETVDARCDVFSLGVMAYEMLTHRLPFTGESLFDIGMKQLAGAVDMAGVPDELADTIRRALAYDKTARPKSARAFAEEVSAIAGVK